MSAHPPTQPQTLYSPLGWAVQYISRIHSLQDEREIGTVEVCYT